MKKRVPYSFFVASIVAALLVSISAKAAGESKGEGRFAIGLTYVNGLSEVSDFVKDSFEDMGYEVDDLQIPVGITFAGGYRFEFGGEIMVDAGPVALMYIDVTGGTTDDDYLYWDVPVGMTLGYALFADKAVSPYVRGGVRYHIAGGDFYDSSTLGPYVAGGLNFFSDKAVQLQFEVAFDAAEVTYEDEFTGRTEDIKPGGLLVSIRAAF
ncbi:MAG: outer membrane beta-barrel protein [bacterium]|nr:outer membrane beta-barrel protein [bacterium]